jgi:DNA-binding Xre family transcriptional regulator
MAIAKAAMRRAQAGVTPITLTRLVRADRTATVLDCEIGDVLEIADQ